MRYLGIGDFIMTEHLKHFERLTLHPLGWTKSAQGNEPLDSSGAPLPWWTYPAIEFVNSMISKSDTVFEYGSGNSTLWWQERVAKVRAVEHDEVWATKVSKNLRGHNEVAFRGRSTDTESDPTLITYKSSNPRIQFPYDAQKIERRGLLDSEYLDYAKEITTHGEKYDWIVIDGMCRRLCPLFAVEFLKEDGIIIFDNSNRSDYKEGYEYLINQGFYQIRFSGSVPGAAFPSTTSIFIRSLKALNKITFEPSLFGIPEY